MTPSIYETEKTVDGEILTIKFYYTPPVKKGRPRGEWFPLEPDDPEEIEIIEIFDLEGHKLSNSKLKEINLEKLECDILDEIEENRRIRFLEY